MEKLYSWEIKRSGAAITIKHSCGRLTGVETVAMVDGEMVATLRDGKRFVLAQADGTRTRLLLVQAERPEDAGMLTVTLSGPQVPDRGRVMGVLMTLFDHDSREWDGSQPNVRLVAENVGS